MHSALHCDSTPSLVVSSEMTGDGPTEGKCAVLQKAVEYMESLLGGILKSEFPSWKLIPYGSFPLRTFLNTTDVDAVVILRGSSGAVLGKDESLSALQRICAYLGQLKVDIKPIAVNENIPPPQASVGDEGFEVLETVLVKSKVPVLKIKLTGGIWMDLTVNKRSGILKMLLIEVLDREFGRIHLVKRSLIMLKSWASNTGVLGSAWRRMSTYALETLLLSIMFMFGEVIQDPRDALRMLAAFYRCTDFFQVVVTICGPVSRTVFSSCQTVEELETAAARSMHTLIQSAISNSERFRDPRQAAAVKNALGAARDMKRAGPQFMRWFREAFDAELYLESDRCEAFHFSPLCIVDPLDFKNNIGLSASSYFVNSVLPEALKALLLAGDSPSGLSDICAAPDTDAEAGTSTCAASFAGSPCVWTEPWYMPHMKLDSSHSMLVQAYLSAHPVFVRSNDIHLASKLRSIIRMANRLQKRRRSWASRPPRYYPVKD